MGLYADDALLSQQVPEYEEADAVARTDVVRDLAPNVSLATSDLFKVVPSTWISGNTIRFLNDERRMVPSVYSVSDTM
jgi:hypothetical protein